MQTKSSNGSKREYWEDQFARWKRSGLSQKKYCEQENVSFWNFKSWYYKIRSVKHDNAFVRINTSTNSNIAGSSKILIRLSDIIKIETDESISEEMLRRIFKASEVLHD